jgi:hypothetical protein
MQTAGAGLPHRRQALAATAAPALVLLAIVVPFLRFHQYDPLLPESLMFLGGAIGIGVLVGGISRLRPAALEPVLIAIVLVVYALSRQDVFDWGLAGAKWLDGLLGHFGTAVGIVLLAFFAALFLACRLLAAHLRSVVIAVFGTMVASTIVLPTPTGGEPVETRALSAKLDQSLPPVVHFILDEHIGLAALPPDMEESAAAARAIRAAYADFALYDRAYSEFAETAYSLSSLMNGSPGTQTLENLEQRPAGWALTQNAWFDRLKQQGYSIRVYQSTWLDMCGESQSVDFCYTYPLFSPNPMQRSSLSAGERLHVLVSKLWLGKLLPQLSPLGSMEALDRLQADLESAPRGAAYVVHLLLPHSGYLYRGDCSLAPPSEWRNGPVGADVHYSADERTRLYRLYLVQLSCTADRIGLVFDQLKRLGVYDEARIVVHGDHGSRIGERPHLHTPVERFSERDLLDHYATLLAIKAPGIGAGAREEPAQLQAVFADTFLGARPEAATGTVLVRTDKDEFEKAQLVWPEPTPGGRIAARPRPEPALR